MNNKPTRISELNNQQGSRTALFQMALQYSLYYSIIGLHLPYLNLYFRQIGFTGSQIGTVTSIKTFCFIIFPLIWGTLADRFRIRKSIFVLCNLISTAIWSLYLIRTDFPGLAAITFAFAVFYSPIISFLEAFSMDILGTAKKNYGKIRLWGSLSFVAMVLVFGKIITSFGVPIILSTSLGFAIAMTCLSFLIPKTDHHATPLSFKSAEFLLRKDVLLFLFSSFLMLASHGAYYGFLSIKLKAEGASYQYIGLVWAVGSIAEIIVMLYSGELFKKIKIETVLVYAFGFAVLRWIIVGLLGHNPFFMLLSQCLHAFTYGCFHMACILFTDRVSGDEAKTLAQTVNASVSYGLGMMTGIFATGLFYDKHSDATFLGCSVVAAVGGLFMKAAMDEHQKRVF